MTAALILAAGTCEDTYKPTIDIGGTSPLRQLIMAFRTAEVKRIVVITGFEAERVERHCAHLGAVFLRNDAYETCDMLTSVKLGLDYLKGKCERVFITPADVPFYTADTITTMIGSTDYDAAIPVCGVATGHPLLISENLFDEIIAYNGNNGLEGALKKAGINRLFVDVEDEGILFDFRSAGMLPDSISRRIGSEIKPGVKVWLSGAKGFFGPGAYHLLTLTTETGSLKLACKQIGISYSKGWKVISNIENQLGYSVITSRQGGRQGGSSELTEKGAELLRRYESFVSDCEDSVDNLFDKHFGDFVF